MENGKWDVKEAKSSVLSTFVKSERNLHIYRPIFHSPFSILHFPFSCSVFLLEDIYESLTFEQTKSPQ